MLEGGPVVLLVSVIAHLVAGPASGAAGEPVSLCAAIETVAPGQQLQVEVEGIYVVTMEGSVFYVPEQPVCVLDVKPATWVEFAHGYAQPPNLRAEIERAGRAWVKFKGTLWARGAIPPDDPADPPMVSYARRIGNLRYRHMNAFPTKLVVESAEFVRAVDKSEPSYGTWSRVRPGSTVPVLVSSLVPQYPEAARMAGIEGAVIARIEVENGLVTKTGIQSGDRILVAAVLDCIASWRFSPTDNRSFSSVFVFELHADRSGSDKNPQLDLRLPTFVRISAPRHGW